MNADSDTWASTVVCLLSAPLFFMFAYYKELKEKSEVIKEINAEKQQKVANFNFQFQKRPGRLLVG